MTDLVVDALLDRAPCGFLSLADDGRVLAANATLLERLGHTRDAVVGGHVQALLAVGSRIFYQTHLFPLIRMHGRAQEVFLLLRAAGGEDVGVLCNATRRERDGAWVTDCIFMEVHERRKYEDALLEARRAAEEAYRIVAQSNYQLQEQSVELELQQHQLQEQTVELEAQADTLVALNEELTARTRELERQRRVADEANRAKSAFLAVMSHELRTPLNAIGGYVQLVLMGVHGPVTEAQAEALSRVERSQRHLLRLINEVLNLSRIEAGHVEYVTAPVPVAELVGSVLPMVEPQVAARGLRCEVNVEAGLTALADRDKAQQILLNLLTNATKFTGAGGRIRIDASRDAMRPDAVVLRVTDSGIGIPADMRDRVFEPFVQVDTSHTRATEGTGLGLAISRDLARGMGGELSLESEEGVGSAFTLVLPGVPASDAPRRASPAVIDAPRALELG